MESTSTSRHDCHVMPAHPCSAFAQVPSTSTNITFVSVRRATTYARVPPRGIAGISCDSVPYLVSPHTPDISLHLSPHALRDAQAQGMGWAEAATTAGMSTLLQFLVPSEVTPPKPAPPAWSKPRAWSQQASTSALSNVKSAPGSNPMVFSVSTAPEASTAPITRSAKPRAWNAKKTFTTLEQLYAKVHEYMHAPLTVPVGLVNQGNSCFASVILQMLVYCRPLYTFLTQLQAMVPQDLSNTTPLLEAIFRFYSEIPVLSKHNSALDENLDAILPDYVYDAMRLHKRFDLFALGHQEDAEEFFSLILNTLHEEVDIVYRRSMQRKQVKGVKAPVSEPAASNNVTMEIQRPSSPDQDEWLEVGQKGKTSLTRTSGTADSHSPITRIFDGKLRSTLSCPGAKTSVMVEPYRSLPLDIQSPRVHTIEDALYHITEPEVISGVWSPQRNATVDATKQVCIEALPPVLVLHLKRFVFDGMYGVQKSTKPIRYGMSLEVSPDILSQPCRLASPTNKYALFGVVYHHGRLATGGHYTVAVRRQDDSGWIHIDDTHVWPIPSEQVLSLPYGTTADSGQAYLLFYQKVNA